jgi:uncharacterized protein YjbI with pentapeptide repeats
MPTKSSDLRGFAAKAKDLQSLRDAVVEGSTVSGALWLSYLFVFFYLGIAAAAVTHRDLFFENSVKLPFLNVELPLVWFFVVGPLLFLIVHAYTLLHFAMLAGKVGHFHRELQCQVRDEVARDRLRRQLPSNVFVQLLAGPRGVRTGSIGFMLRSIAWISLIIGPVLLLVFFQLQFLPYHDAAISWWQRIAVLLDLIVLWSLWPSIARGRMTSLHWRDFRRAKIASLGVFSFVPALLVFTVATFPGEWLNDNGPAIPVVPAEWTPHRLLIAGEVDEVAQRPRSLWSNRLVVPGIDVIDRAKYDSEAKIAALPVSVSLRGRRLEGAVLSNANLRKSDLTGAELSEAKLDGADLREAKLACINTKLPNCAEAQCTNLRGASLRRAQLRDTSLAGALLQNASLESAQLQSTRLDCAKLHGATLDRAQLQGASLFLAQLQGASISLAELQDASLFRTQLQGAALHAAQLQGANLHQAELQGASLHKASLKGAFLDYAQLQGALLDMADLQGASLQGATLYRAQLQGASLAGAQLQGASLSDVCVWRADTSGAAGEGAYVENPVSEIKDNNRGSPLSLICHWSTQSYSALVRLIQERVPLEGLQKIALDRILRLDPDKQVEESSSFWSTLEKNRPRLDEYKENLVEILRTVGCDVREGPYVLRGLARGLRYRFGFGPDRNTASELAAAFLDQTRCPGARGLSEEDTHMLRSIRERAQP